MLINRHNQHGVKDSAHCYLAGGKWKQWVDLDGLWSKGALKERIAELKYEHMRHTFMYRKMDFGYRIYYRDIYDTN